MAVNGPDLYVPRGSDWIRSFELTAGTAVTDISTWSIGGFLRDNWQPLGNAIASANINIVGSAPTTTFTAAFSASQLLLPTTDQIMAFQAQNGMGAILPNFTYYFSIWRLDISWELFKCRYIIEPSSDN